MTDIIGHKSNMELAVRELELLDSFLLELEGCIDPQEDVVIITSDHGNIEDITVRTHTMNKVPTVIIGRVEESTAAGISSLTDIMPAVLEMFEQRGDRE